MNKPEYFNKIRTEASKHWDQLENDPILAAPWHQLFRQVQSPRHVISELLQNADDSGATKAVVKFDGSDFVFTHDGSDFNQAQFASLCRFGYSNKRVLHTIGFRGVGFKSTFSIGDDVQLTTPTLSVTFNKQRFTEPNWITLCSPVRKETQIRIKIKSDKVKHALNENIREWYQSPVSLLFFRNIRTLQVHDRGINWISQGPGPVDRSEWMSSSMEPNATYLVIRSPEEEIPENAQTEIAEERMATDDQIKLPPCRVEIVLGMPGRLFVVLPTELKTSLPFACNAPFIQDTARMTIKDPAISPTNTWLLQRAGKLAAEALLTWLGQADLSQRDRSRAYDLFPDASSENTSIQGECWTIVVDSFEEHCEEKPLLLTETSTLELTGNCLTVPDELLRIWPSNQISHGFSTKQLPILSHHVTNKNRKKLINWSHIEQLTKNGVLEKLKISRLPRPPRNQQLMRLWTYVSNDVTRPRTDYLNVRIVPVHGQNLLFSPDEVVRINRRALTSRDWQFLESHFLEIDPAWIQSLQLLAQDTNPNDSINETQLHSVLDVLRTIGLHETTNANKMFRQVISKFNANSFNSPATYVHLAHIAAKLNIRPPSDFRFITQGSWIRRSDDSTLLVDLNGTLNELIEPIYYKAHALHPDYMVFTDTCTETEWKQWTRSSRTNLNMFVSLEQTTVNIFTREKLRQLLRKRGFNKDPNYPYKRGYFTFMDWDFDQSHWTYWHTLEDCNENIWGHLMEHLLALPMSFWENVKSAIANQVATNGWTREVTREPLLPEWVIRFRNLPCLLDTSGHVRLPTELLRRTAETEPLLGLEPFVKKELDTLENQWLLDLLGVRNKVTEPNLVLEHLRALASTIPPIVPEVLKWCNALDQLFDGCSADELHEVENAFASDKLILTDQLEWMTAEEVFLEADNNSVPGAPLIHPSIKAFSFWTKIGVSARPSVANEIEWICRLTPGIELNPPQMQRIIRLMAVCPDRIWDECCHWLNLKGEWTPISSLTFSLTKHSLIQFNHLFPDVRARTADLRPLSSETAQNFRSSVLQHLEDVIEERFQGQPALPDSQVKEWLITLGRGLRRVELEDREMKDRVDRLAARLTRTKWQVTEGLESVPYIDGTPVGKSRLVDVLWWEYSLFVPSGSSAKLAKVVSLEIGRVFGWDEITDAIKLCYERAPEFINEYLIENFSLISDTGFGASPITDSFVPLDSRYDEDASSEFQSDDVSRIDSDDRVLDPHGNSNVSEGSHIRYNSGESADGFAREFLSAQTVAPSPAPDHFNVFPFGSRNTSQAAKHYTISSRKVGQTEAHVLNLIQKHELGPKGKALEAEFRSMVEGDYGKRCQICSRTFAKPSGDWLVNVVHVVPPRKDHRTNHFGDLLGLCGWHFNLLQYGQWALLDPNNGQPFEDKDGVRGWERMREFILTRVPATDDLGNQYIGLPIQFSNVYQEWLSEPVPIVEEIRYSIPHWKFLCELLNE